MATRQIGDVRRALMTVAEQVRMSESINVEIAVTLEDVVSALNNDAKQGDVTDAHLTRIAVEALETLHGWRTKDWTLGQVEAAKTRIGTLAVS